MKFVINDEKEPDTSPNSDIVPDPDVPDIQNIVLEPGDDLIPGAVTATEMEALLGTEVRDSVGVEDNVVDNNDDEDDKVKRPKKKKSEKENMADLIDQAVQATERECLSAL